MSLLRRYVVWKAPDARAVSELVALASKDGREIEDRGDFLVLRLLEEEIEQAFRADPEGRLLPPPGLTLGDRSFHAPDLERLGLDLPIALADSAGRRHAAARVSLSERGRAEALVGADDLRAFAAGGARRVNVVLVDGGVDYGHLAALGHAGQPDVLHGPRPPAHDPRRRASRRHAHVLARSVLSLAPAARIVDLPVLPERIDNVDAFTSDVLGPVIALGQRIAAGLSPGSDASWVVVCAWSLVSRDHDRPTGSYAENRGHLLSAMFRFLAALDVDIVFSAGNNGAFEPDPRSSWRDRGPFWSITGSNGLPEALTVGAVTARGDWIGGSAQGPEPEGVRPPDAALAPRKPDVCAPSWFRETDDRHAVSTGTSAACAMAAGVVAAVRRRVPPSALSPAALVELIRDTALREGYAGGATRETPAEMRLGSGIIDGAALARALGSTGCVLRGSGYARRTVCPAGPVVRRILAPWRWISGGG